MPIETDEPLQEMLTDGRISGITLDTNVFDGQRLNLKSSAMRIVTGLKDIPFPLVLSSTVLSEVRRHLAKGSEDSLRALKKAVGDALFAWDVEKPTRDELLTQVTSGRSPADAAIARLDGFLKEAGGEVVDDFKLVDTATVYGAYFDRRPPFKRGEKSEFPDALALNALEAAAAQRKTSFLVVSADGDWRDFCASSERLYLVTTLEKALDLINDAPVGLRKAVVDWFGEGQIGRVELATEVSKVIGGLDVDVSAYASFGEVATHAWAPEVETIGWPDEEDVDVIETEDVEDGTYRAIVSLPLVLTLRFSVELEFSHWDGVDRESVGMGGRTEEIERAEDARVTVTIDLHDIGKEEEDLLLVETELDLTSLHLDLGEVEMFEPEDYDRDFD